MVPMSESSILYNCASYSHDDFIRRMEPNLTSTHIDTCITTAAGVDKTALDVSLETCTSVAPQTAV